MLWLSNKGNSSNNSKLYFDILPFKGRINNYQKIYSQKHTVITRRDNKINKGIFITRMTFSSTEKLTSQSRTTDKPKIHITDEGITINYSIPPFTRLF